MVLCCVRGVELSCNYPFLPSFLKRVRPQAWVFLKFAQHQTCKTPVTRILHRLTVIHVCSRVPPSLQKRALVRILCLFIILQSKGGFPRLYLRHLISISPLRHPKSMTGHISLTESTLGPTGSRSKYHHTGSLKKFRHRYALLN